MQTCNIFWDAGWQIRTRRTRCTCGGVASHLVIPVLRPPALSLELVHLELGDGSGRLREMVEWEEELGIWQDLGELGISTETRRPLNKTSPSYMIFPSQQNSDSGSTLSQQATSARYGCKQATDPFAHETNRSDHFYTFWDMCDQCAHPARVHWRMVRLSRGLSSKHHIFILLIYSLIPYQVSAMPLPVKTWRRSRDQF